jgi:hypothetical protein
MSLLKKLAASHLPNQGRSSKQIAEHRREPPTGVPHNVNTFCKCEIQSCRLIVERIARDPKSLDAVKMTASATMHSR